MSTSTLISLIVYSNQEMISKVKSQDLAIHTHQSVPKKWHQANLKCSSRPLDGHPKMHMDVQPLQACLDLKVEL